MKHSRDTSKQIDKELAAVESEITQRRQKLRVLEAQREKLKTAQSVLLDLQGKTPLSGQPLVAKAETQNVIDGRRCFHAEGQTASLVRYVYGKGTGSTVLEAAKRSGVSTRRTRAAFERLCKSGMMSRSGNEYALTQKGIAAWQESPLFGWEPGR